MSLKTVIILCVLSTLITAQETSICENPDKTVETFNDCVYSTVGVNEDCCFLQYTNTEDTTITQCKLVEIVEGTTSDESVKSAITDLKENTEATVVCPTKGVIANNCGVVGEGMPNKKEHCSAVTIPERFCCMLTYTYNEQSYNVCRVVKEYINEGKTTKEAQKIIEKLEGASLQSGVCSGGFVKYALVSFALWISMCLF